MYYGNEKHEIQRVCTVVIRLPLACASDQSEKVCFIYLTEYGIWNSNKTSYTFTITMHACIRNIISVR